MLRGQRNHVGIQQPLDVRAVVNDLVVAAELRELVAHLMKAVRAESDDGLHFVAVQRLDGALCQHLVQILVAEPARGIAVAGLFLAEDREVDVGRLQDAREGDGDLLRSIVEAAHAADPEQDVGTLSFRERLGVRRNVQAFRPERAISRAECPRRGVRLQRLERRLHFLGKATLVQHQPATQLVDDVQLVDAHRAFRHAGAAAGAGPELLFRDVVVEQTIPEGVSGARCFQQQRRTAFHIQLAGHQRCLLHQATTRVHHDLARAERLAGDVGRTSRRAATAFRAAVPVEQVLPAQVIDVQRAELLHLGLQIHRLHHADLTGTAGVAEPDVDQRAHHVQMLGVRQEVQEAQHQQRM